MTETQQKIVENLDRQFSEMGFATQGVEALREGANVSLHTLYKYFPSCEAMVIGALAAYPESDAIRAASAEHKAHVREMFRDRLLTVNQNCAVEPLSEALFVLHEGLMESARIIGIKQATDATLRCARTLLSSASIH